MLKFEERIVGERRQGKYNQQSKAPIWINPYHVSAIEALHLSDKGPGASRITLISGATFEINARADELQWEINNYKIEQELQQKARMESL